MRERFSESNQPARQPARRNRPTLCADRSGLMTRTRARKCRMSVQVARFLTEAEFQQRSADANLTPYEIAQDPKRYAIATVLAAANRASNGRAGVTAKSIQ